MAQFLTRDAREDLRRLSLTINQIDELERALPSASAWLKPSAPMKDVLDKLLDIRGALKAALYSCTNVAEGTLPAQKEARNRILLSDADIRLSDGEFGLVSDDDVLGDVIAALNRASKAAHRATDELPKVQRRTNEVSLIVMRLIDEALVKSGALATLKKGRRSLQRSSTPRSNYFEIVSICMAAMGVQSPNPQRQIKAHLQWLKGRSVWLKSRSASVRCDSLLDGRV